jgi:hypothetical protein
VIKARLVTEAGPIAVLGLSGENVTRLVAGEPIVVDLAELGMSGRVVVMYGRTEHDIVTELGEVGLFNPPPD